MASKETLAKKKLDIDALERDYRTGNFTDQELGDKYGRSRQMVAKYATTRGWPRAKNWNGDAVKAKNDDYAKPGYVYLACVSDSAGVVFTKIGMATHLESRIKSHQTSNPFDVKIAMSYYVGNMQKEESDLHEIFASKRVRGEWFALSHADLMDVAKRSVLVSNEMK